MLSLPREYMEPWEIEPLTEEEAAAYEARSEKFRWFGKVTLAIMMSTMILTWVTKYFFMALLYIHESPSVGTVYAHQSFHRHR